MRFHYSAAALALLTSASLAEECPAGYAKSKGLTWTNCPVAKNPKLQCATIMVPKDWKDPASMEMKLRLVRHPAASENALGDRSVIINPGGPGASGIETVIDGGSMYQGVIGDDFHIIGFDPRGVGLTIPYKCVDTAETTQPADTKSGDSTSEDTNSETTKAARAIAEVEDQTGTFQDYTAYGKYCDKTEVDGKLVGTAYVARDVKAIAESLGEDGLIRYMGYSYGTLLGATIAAMFPKNVDRIVLDGNVNAQDYYYGLGIESLTDFDKAVRRFFDLCAQAGSNDCAWAVHGKDEKTLTEKYDSFLASLSKSQSNSVRALFFNVLYTTDFKEFAAKLQSWFEKPASIPGDAQVTGNSKRDSDTFDATSGLSIKTPTAISAISCGDRIPKPDGTPELFKKWLEDYQVVTKYAWDVASAGTLRCSVWPTRANERYEGGFNNVIDTKNPILFLSTPYDPVTPMISAETNAKAFKGAKVLKSSGLGHCTTTNWSGKLNELVRKYMIEGTIPTTDEIFKPDIENVFSSEAAKPAVQAGVHSKRDFRYPDFFSKREEAAAAEQVPAGCTKIPMSSSALVSASASVAPSASVSLSVSVSASASASQSVEPTPAASPAASESASGSIVLSHSESASASALVVPSASVSQSQEPTPSASVSASVSPAGSASVVVSHSESASASVADTPSASASHSESVLVLATASASVSALYEPSPSASASVSASESLVISHSESASASVTIQQPSESLQASITPSASASESYAVSASPSASAHSDSVSVFSTHVSSSIIYSDVSPSASASVAGDTSSVIGSASASASASVSMDYATTASSVAQSSSYPVESLTPSASATPVYNQGSSSIIASASYSAATSVEHSSSSGLYLSSDVQASHSASSYPPSVPSSSVYVGVSSSVYPDVSSSAVSGSASLSYSAPMSSSSAVYSDSSIVHPSPSSGAVYPDTSVYPSASSSDVYSQSSKYPSGSSSNADYTRSSVTGSAGSYYPTSAPVYSSGSFIASSSSKTKPVHNHYPTSKPYASSTPAKSFDSKYPYSSPVPAYSSSIASYPKGDDYDYSSGNAYPTGYYPVITSGKSQGPKTTSAPCITVPWSSQPGYVPITKTYTTTSVRTITKCPDTVKDCPLNSSTKTYITTEVKTRTTVVATPSSPPTGNKSYPPNKESDKKSSAPPSKETGKVPSPPKDSGYSFQPTKDTGKGGQSPKETKPATSLPPKDTGYPSQPSKPTGNSPQPPKETKPIQSTHSAYAPPKISSNPSVPTSVPPYPTGPSAPSSIKVCNAMKCSYVAVPSGTKPVTSTGASTTLKTSTPSVSVCFGKDCKATGTPTGYKPAEFTGAASNNFVSSMVGAGAMIVAFARFF
ncbi:hypothetical protein E8E11_001306 [Didymella keratinophila]|nr:hypothetical protein E8E11_001306 [Didymella keratinophila]